ncbi:hypothetical protein NDU88_000496 [Pleurodeles waltl]|uniref:Uncharacterized protein n=1 Tax=Pleurodeles waltl TaxID=8319 RepID=A0AAV7P4C3_PLEWA|nr:hypothetical protein NDU88_000496 [Pleurodeles waltl]
MLPRGGDTHQTRSEPATPCSGSALRCGLQPWAKPQPPVMARPKMDRGKDGRSGSERLREECAPWGQVLQAVAMHTQITDRDKSRSPLKPTAAPPDDKDAWHITRTEMLVNMESWARCNGRPTEKTDG